MTQCKLDEARDDGDGGDDVHSLVFASQLKQPLMVIKDEDMGS